MEEKEYKEALLLKTFYDLIAAILGQSSNPESELRRIMSDSISGYGTGKHEIFNSYQEYLEKIYRVFGKQLPPNANFHFFDIRHSMTGNVGIVHGTYEIRYTVEGVESNYYGRRSTVFEWVNDCWRAIHLHVSEASAHLVEGESLPVEALKAQNEELKKQVSLKTEALHNSLKSLQETQQQLIYSAKMASLGELTAGIAHEIQNPLNFVNNFSEVNKELLLEIKEELKLGKYDEAKSITENVIVNEEKINHHGKRAEGIVKNMLMHSSAGSGQKEVTDLNAMAGEYLRLACQKMKADDKTFNIKIETGLDPGLPPVKVVPQDIGRVLLNIINNALYAVDEKRKTSGKDYMPSIRVISRTLPGKVEISVIDNGNGIPESLKEKVFQPFYTTKPAGKGTGLGLSMSYDVIKAHGGELNVSTKTGEGTEFIIVLPLNHKNDK